jgi:fructose-1,6-bisphosphatase/inositol monophosphatase family enzyme
VISAKSRSFGRLAGNPAQGVNGGKMAHSLRSVGSAALNFAMVAQGGLDLYWYLFPVYDNFCVYDLIKGNWMLAMGCICWNSDC